MTALTLAVERLAAATVLSCHGELVAASAMQLETALSQVLLRPQTRIVVDLAAVATIDCTGVMMLRVTAGIATEQGGSLVLAGPNTQVVNTLREGGSLSTIPTYRTVQAALDSDAGALITETDAAAAPTAWPMNRSDRRTA
ncbi:STAS domain-containing protein [Dactylosporangium sp. NPDC048998]|uniref:STAS domain-containing protein n=1 Tax=Dactylosporangium sp. NPDC048998 TaxID=3363976 RepID=UPI00371D0E5F